MKMHGSLLNGTSAMLQRIPMFKLAACLWRSVPAGKQLLTIWDRICTLLRAREVSTEDVSNKSGMLLRVLHTAAYGRTWWVHTAHNSLHHAEYRHAHHELLSTVLLMHCMVVMYL